MLKMPRFLVLNAGVLEIEISLLSFFNGTHKLFIITNLLLGLCLPMVQGAIFTYCFIFHFQINDKNI